MLSSVLTLTFEAYIESRFASSGSGKEANVVLVMFWLWHAQLALICDQAIACSAVGVAYALQS